MIVRLLPGIVFVFGLGFHSACGSRLSSPSAVGAAKSAKSTANTQANTQEEKDPVMASLLSTPPRGPFGYSLLSSEDGHRLSLQDFASDQECGTCHERQAKESEGSVHSIAHTDLLYRRMAELARREVGPELYTYCSGCHSPQGVSTGIIPDTDESALPQVVKDGILCNVCHQVTRLSGADGPWGEPGNASIVLHPDPERKFGPPSGDNDAAEHEVETREFLSTSEFCASCHTVIHALNGIRLEHTYAEWKKSIYAQKKIHCQDCHMRSVKDSIQVAQTLKPVSVQGKSTSDGELRPIAPHSFVGANPNTAILGGNPNHATMGEDRLRSAARLELRANKNVPKGAVLTIELLVHNIGAGHNLPTSLIELRQMWVELTAIDGDGTVLLHLGALLPNGDIPKGTMRFGAQAGDVEGRKTAKPWEVTHFLFKRLIPPKGFESDRFTLRIPVDAKSPIHLEAILYYRSASPNVVTGLLGSNTQLKRVKMDRAEATVDISPTP